MKCVHTFRTVRHKRQADIFIVSVYNVNGQLRRKVMATLRRNESCQRTKTTWSDVFFPFAFESKRRFEKKCAQDVRHCYSVCKLSDETCQSCFSHNENIKYLTIKYQLSRWCASKAFQYMSEMLTPSLLDLFLLYINHSLWHSLSLPIPQTLNVHNE